MLIEGGGRSRGHGLSTQVLCAQAASLGVPITFRPTSWADYEATFLSAAKDLAEEGVEAGVFGDIDVDAHREWVEGVCARAGVAAFEPLWKENRRELIEEFLAEGFAAKIVALKDGVLDADVLGRELDAGLVSQLEAHGVDPAGENGEYHTVVVAGPIFAEPVRLEEKGRVLRDGYWFLDLAPADES